MNDLITEEAIKTFGVGTYKAIGFVVGASWAIANSDSFWIKVHSEADLPEDPNVLYSIAFNGEVLRNGCYKCYYKLSEVIELFKSRVFTHYIAHRIDAPRIYFK